jgi:hypothetical protein
MKAMSRAALLASCLVVVACGNDDSNGAPADTSGEGGAAGAPADSAGDDCHDGCVATLAAACDNGPADAPTCESDCRSLSLGKCAAQYETLLSCARGKAVECSAQGLPIVPECSDEQAAFVACLSG